MVSGKLCIRLKGIIGWIKFLENLHTKAVNCNTILFAGNLKPSLRYYHWEDFEELNNQTSVDLKEN